MLAQLGVQPEFTEFITEFIIVIDREGQMATFFERPYGRIWRCIISALWTAAAIRPPSAFSNCSECFTTGRSTGRYYNAGTTRQRLPGSDYNTKKKSDFKAVTMRLKQRTSAANNWFVNLSNSYVTETPALPWNAPSGRPAYEKSRFQLQVSSQTPTSTRRRAPMLRFVRENFAFLRKPVPFLPECLVSLSGPRTTFAPFRELLSFFW